MAIREILELGNPILRQVCKEVDIEKDNSLAALVEDLRDTVSHSRKSTGYGRAIAAPQIGVLKRAVYLLAPREIILFNPVIIDKSDEQIVVWDACLSFLSIFMKVVRHRWIKVRYFDQWGNVQTLLADEKDDLAELLQHEIDHLDGILALDRVSDLKTICSRKEFEARFRSNTPYAGRSYEDESDRRAEA